MIDPAAFRAAFCTECNRRVVDLEEPCARARLKCPRCKRLVIAVLANAERRMVTA